MNKFRPTDVQKKVEGYVQKKVERARAVASAGFNLAPVAGAIIMTAMIIAFVSGHSFVALTILVVALILSLVMGV